MNNKEPDSKTSKESLALSDAAEHLLDEARMVLPGMQALFGFQVIAVFSPGFSDLEDSGQQLRLAAIALVAIAVAVIMTPAAYHRLTGPREVTESFIELSTRLLLWSMAPLALGVCIDFYLISSVIVDGSVSAVFAALLFAVFIGLWFIFPKLRMRMTGSK